MKEIKVIDLVVKIANGEIPKKIRYNDLFMTYDEKRYNYYDSFGAEIDWKYTIMQYLNDKVEIIEDTPKEDKKIEKIETIKDNDGNDFLLTYDGKKYIISIVDAIMINKINEIIDKINGGNYEN